MKNLLLSIMTLAITIAIMSSCEKHEFEEPGSLVPLTVIEDPGIPSINVNNTMLHSETFGDPSNPMIIAIHGGPGGDYRSILNCQEFANDGYYVVFYDQRGSGLSQRFDADIYNMQIYIYALEAVIEYYKTSPEQDVILMGHSWGAMLAAAYVNQYPDKTDGLVLMEPGGLTMKDMEDYVERALPMNLFDESVSDLVYMDQFITSDEHEVLDYKASIRPDFGHNVGDSEPMPFWRFGAICNKGSFEYVSENSFDFTTNLHLYDTNVLFAYSELNKAYGKEHAEMVSSAFPNVELVEIMGTGHEIPCFGWESYYPIALNYLNELTNK